MKIMLRVMALTLTVFLAAVLANAPQKEELQVVYNLSGAVQSLENKEQVVTFSDDMLPLGGKRDGAAILKITPAIAGEFLWRGNRSLAFKPATRFRYSTTYTAVIPAGTKSLSGKMLPKEIRWQWSTPLAYPVEVRSAAQEYFSTLAARERLDFQVWVKDSLFLRFDQPVSAAAARDFIILKEAESGTRAKIRLSQKGADTIAIQYEKPLERGMLYQLILKKGFCGSEGGTGTSDEFTFVFDTVPAFRYTEKGPLILHPDAPYCLLPFSNPLAEFNASFVKVFRSSGKQRTPLKFHLEPRYHRNEALFLNIDDDLASGDALRIQVDRRLLNIYKEMLPENLDLEAGVCSSRSPHIGFSLQDKKLSMDVKSMKQARIRLLKFKPAFFTRLSSLDPGILQGKGFKDEFIEKEILRNFTDLPERENSPALRDGELGSPLGFFGFLVQRYEPYNACRDVWMMRLPLFLSPQLEVFHRRDMDMVIKAGAKQTLFWLYDNRSGKGLGDKPVLMHDWRGDEPLGRTAASGILLSDRWVQAGDLVVAKDERSGDMALDRIDYPPDSAREVRISVFSDRDFYKPGDAVHIAGVIKEYISGQVSSIKAQAAYLEITGPDWQKVKSDQLPLDPLGGFHYEFNSDPAGKKGRYHILVRYQESEQWQGRHEVTIDYYQPNTFQLSLADVAERYRFQDSFRPKISGAYLAGNPMAGNDLAYKLELNPLGAGVFPSGNLTRYSFGLDPDLALSDPSFSGAGKLDREGKRGLDIPMNRFNRTNYLAGLDFSATGKSAEGKEFTARGRSVFFPGDRLTGIQIGYYQNLKDPVHAELALLDFQGKPASGEVHITLYREYYVNYQRKLKKVSGPDDVYIDKVKSHEFRANAAGRYILCCDTPDADGRVVSTSAQFFAWDSAYSDQDESLRIESEQTTLRTGGKLKCFIRSPQAGQALVTVERGKVLDSMVIGLQKMTPLEFPVKKEYFPAIRVSVVAIYKNNSSEEASLDFQVMDEAKTLHIGLESPAEIKPASTAKLKIHVSDPQRKGVQAKLFVYAVDEGNLSLQGYQAPDLSERFYYLDPLGRNAIRTYYSRDFTHWTFARPMMDIDLAGPAIFGCIFRPDAAPIAGATVTLEDEKHNMLKTVATSAQGYYQFPGLAGGRYSVKAEAKGFQLFVHDDVYFSGSGHLPCDLVLIPIGEEKYWEPEPELGAAGRMVEGAVEAIAPAPMAADKMMMAKEAKGKPGSAGKDSSEIDVTGIRVRSDFKEVLFFKTIETDEAGNAAVDFESSDQLSTYRIMAIAYSEDSFGKSEKKIVVSKDLLLSEAMPEFARQNDKFQAGVQVSNRTAQNLTFTLLAKPLGITVDGAAQAQHVLDPRSNDLFRFPFRADRIGEAQVDFFAVSAADKDGLQKKLPVTDRLVSETLLDFASGKNVRKAIEPQAEGEEQVVTIKAAPSLLRPAVNIAKKLVFYPYECLEQRTSKVMPFLALSPALAERLELGLDQKQIREAIDGYLKIVPEFMAENGALSYYRGGQYTSDYLTAYVLWALHLATENDYKVEPQLVQKLAGYLQHATLDKTTDCFYQFVLSLHKEADNKKLKKLAAERDTLSMQGRVFLYRALHNQGIEAGLLKTMLAEFNNSLQVEADFAYFDAGEFKYNRDYPFYSSRFTTALLLQAVLEVEKGHVLTERIINWLLEGEPYCWNTTQTNFWILCAMDEYLKQVEKTTARRAEIVLLGEKAAREFANSRDTLTFSKKLTDLKKPVEALISADQPVYVTSELTWKLARAGKKSRGIDIQRLAYDEKGRVAETFKLGQVYQVELLIRTDKEIPYGVIDEPLAAGFELLRQDISSTRALAEFNTDNKPQYYAPWLRQENSADRLVFYTYSMQGRMRIVYFVKAMYSGRFTWLPAVAQGMYHPQYFGRCAMQSVEIAE